MSQIVAPETYWTLALDLAHGISTAVAAEKAGLSARAVQHRLRKPAFRKLVADLRSRLIETALGRMAKNMTRAADAIESLLDVDDPALRLRAAQAMLRLGIKLRDSVDLSERISAVASELDARQGILP